MEYVHMQNEIISAVLVDMDKLRSMILDIHKEQQYIKRVFLKPQPPPAPRPVTVPDKPSPRVNVVQRPTSVQTKLPNIVPRPPQVRRRTPNPRQRMIQPNMVF